jgi:hypothetical protein
MHKMQWIRSFNWAKFSSLCWLCSSSLFFIIKQCFLHKFSTENKPHDSWWSEVNELFV